MSQCKLCGKSGILLKTNSEGMCSECTEKELQRLRALVTPEHCALMSLQDEIESTTKQRDKMNCELNDIAAQLHTLYDSIEQKKALLIQTDEQLLLQEFGLYEPKYDFCNSDDYQNRLLQIRQKQKDMIKEGTAVTGNMKWTVNNSLAQGKKMVQDMQKLLLRAFNSECDEVINKVKYSNFDASLKRISNSHIAISKLGIIMQVGITKPYYDGKIDELTLALEYQQMKQREKEAQKEAREQMREEAKLQREIEEARRTTAKEKSHYENALKKITVQLESASGDEKAMLESKKQELEEKIEDAEKAIKDIDYREANQRAGYVYVISNIGSFGENVYKIGMTRRLDPTERVSELGDASVPFDFDIHAMIFSDDAPALEAALHRAFDNRKLNMVNMRREFFKVSLQEIKEEVKKHYDKTAEFIELADAEQYRISQKMREQKEVVS
jgi:hypothetical protein